jgi:hypothetical protein
MNAARQPRIRIDDLPALETLSDEEKARIFGAGRLRLGVEALEDRLLMTAAHVYTPPPPTYTPPPPMVQHAVMTAAHVYTPPPPTYTPPPPTGSHVGTAQIHVPSVVHSTPAAAEPTAAAAHHNTLKLHDPVNAHPAHSPQGTGASSTPESNVSSSSSQDLLLIAAFDPGAIQNLGKNLDILLGLGGASGALSGSPSHGVSAPAGNVGGYGSGGSAAYVPGTSTIGNAQFELTNTISGYGGYVDNPTSLGTVGGYLGTDYGTDLA